MSVCLGFDSILLQVSQYHECNVQHVGSEELVEKDMSTVIIWRHPQNQ